MTGVGDTGHKFITGVLDMRKNLCMIYDTRDKFMTGVADAGG